MRLFLEIYALFWIPMGHKCYKLMLGCNKTYSLINGVQSIIWPDICRKNSGTVSCKYIRIYPLRKKFTEISITCVDGEVCSQSTTYSDQCYYMVIDNGTLYQTCNCCGHLCDEEIYQPDSGDMGTMLANVNQFWIITDISVTSIIFMLLIIFANFCIFIIIFDDLTYLCIFMWAYLAKLWDFDHKLPQRCKLKPVAQFLKKHKLLDHCVPRNLFIFTKNHSTSFLNTKSARENRYLTRLRRDYQNIRTQVKNILFIHYLIKRITATHSVRIRLDELRSVEFELSIQETIRADDNL
ncbi:hypothetical protein X798_07734 [Onchocerca flexuosa]|uniref:Uncharacterized protein n=1 Tax=Onchocerca flexuosa TaxID=387005 RepID=A0A238BL94_9BILA|nr:hypothetical protein X798_07734 [Onchocerca flexuosa]